MLTLYWPFVLRTELNKDKKYYAYGKTLNSNKLVIVLELNETFCSKRTVATVNFSELPLIFIHLSTYLENAEYLIPQKIEHFTKQTTLCQENSLNFSSALSHSLYDSSYDEVVNVVLYQRDTLYTFPKLNIQVPYVQNIKAQFTPNSTFPSLESLSIGIISNNCRNNTNSLPLTSPENIPEHECSFWSSPFQKYITNSALLPNISFSASILSNIQLKRNLSATNHQCAVYLDALFGTCLGFILLRYFSFWKQFVFQFYTTFTINCYKWLITWLMGWPAGLKLNSNLNRFLGEMFLWMLSWWTNLIFTILEYDSLPWISWFLLLSTVLGVSTFCALLNDFIYIGSVHLRFIDFIASKIHRFQWSVLFSLFQLFKGKKWNSLRSRYDSADYETEQLLVGTILFTILTYLYPTVLAYFIPFYATRKFLRFIGYSLTAIQRSILYFPDELLTGKNIPYSIKFNRKAILDADKMKFYELTSTNKAKLAVLKTYFQKIFEI